VNAVAAETPPWDADVRLADGRTVHLRRLGPDDDDALAAFYDHLSDGSVYSRFFSPLPRSSAVQFEHPASADDDRELAIAAECGGEVVAVAHYRRVGPSEADVAFAVTDDMQGHGLGTVLIRRLAVAARAHGIDTFVAETLPDNRRMLGAFHDAGFPFEHHFAGGLVHVRATIAGTTPRTAP